MKILKLPVIGLALVLVASSCQKKDVYQDTTAQDQTIQNPGSVQKLQFSNWKTAGSWQSAKQDDYAVYYSNIEDSKITADVASDGLVLVYKKNGASTVAMPYEDNTGKIYWYHQVTEGNLLILCDEKGAASQPAAENSFNYIIITPAQLQSLETKGHTRSDLMDMTYEQANQLISESK